MADISQIQNGESLTLRQQIALTAKLSVPAIIAQLSTIMMQYIDASMVGHLGADASASVGLMNSSLWMFWGVCSTITMGFRCRWPTVWGHATQAVPVPCCARE